MKQIYIITGILLSIGMSACRERENYQPTEIRLQISSESYRKSKVYLEGMSLKWAPNDVFSVYDDATPWERNNFLFSLTSAPGHSTGSFEGIVSYMPQRNNLYAFYPYQTKSHYTLQQHPVSVPQSQEQYSLEDSLSIGKYFRMASKVDFIENTSSYSMQFKVLTAVWEFHLLNRSALSHGVRSLEIHLLSCETGKGFLLETTYDLGTQCFNTLATDRYVQSLRMDGLDKVAVGKPYLMVTLPSKMTLAKLQYRLELSDGSILVFDRIPMELDLQGGLYYSTLLDVSAPDAVWGEEIYSENMGDQAVASATALSGFFNWKKAGKGGQEVQYAGTADIRSTVPSPSVFPYSGGNNVFFGTLPRHFWIKNIDVMGQQSLTLEWSMIHYGYYLYSTDMDVQVSLNKGLTWHTLAYDNPELNAWQRCKTSFCIPANTKTLDIRYLANEGSVLRLDDLRVTSGGSGPFLDPNSPQNAQYISGEIILAQDISEAVAGPMSSYLFPSNLIISTVTLQGTIGPNYLSASKWLNNSQRFWLIEVPVVKELSDSVRVSYSLYSSATGPRDFSVFAAVDQYLFKPVNGTVPQLVAETNNKIVSFTFVIPKSENARLGSYLYFKIMPSSAVSANGGTVSTTGTSRIAGTFVVTKL